MENKNLPAKRNPQEITLIESRAAEITSIIADVNMLIGFPIEGRELAVWAQDVCRKRPDVDAEALRLLFDGFKTEEIPWDKSKGIQNIFKGLEWIQKTETGYEIKRPRVW